MLKCAYRSHLGFVIGEIWFAKKRQPIDEMKVDVVHYYQTEEPVAPGCSVFKTLISDLTKSHETMFQRFDKHCRYKIKKSEREDIDIQIYDWEFLKKQPQVLAGFVSFYNRFAKSKGLDCINHTKCLQAYIDSGAFTLTVALKGETPLVYHAYIHNDDCARILYTASLFRETADSNEKSAIGRANRLLHWRDMLYFKQRGFTRYDWGGIGETEEYKGIDDFKRSFGGTRELVYNARFACSMKGRLFNILRYILKRH